MVICLHCVNYFEQKRKNQKFCNTQCYNASEYKREYNKKNCNNHYHIKGGKERRQHRHKRRVYWVNKYKKAMGCQRCFWDLDTVALDFDHINPFDKLFNISRALRDLSYTVKDIINEIRKCKLYCANCHRILTKEQNLYYNKRLIK